MPTVAIIDGVKIQFYWDDHPPPHFHAEYGECRAKFSISSLAAEAQHRKVIAWAKSRRTELLDAWVKCQSDLHPGKIA